MFNNYKVKVLIFAGRKDTMSILIPQIKCEFIDEIIIGVNTNNQEDLNFIYSLKEKEPKITYLEVPKNIKKCTQESFRFFYTKMEDEDTIYFKLDDDLIYIEPGYFEKTLKFRCEYPEYICIYPMIINNPLCNYLLRNDIPMKYKKDNPGEFMYASWKDPDVAEHLLRLFAQFKNKKELWHIKNFEFGKEQNYHLIGGRIIRPSINAICFFGKDFKNLNVKNYPNDDEEFLTNHVFNCGRKSIVFGDTLVVHYAFFTQRNYLNSKNILGYYK
jgi:hypothetical protein